MDEFLYSNGALDTLENFHRKKFVIFVEGEDDIPYWNNIFRVVGLKDFIIKPSGGKNEIEKFSQAIILENASIYVARDSDFRTILGYPYRHPRIVWTYGHSIENSLYHPLHLAQIISMHARVQDYEVSRVENWLTTFCNQFIPLLIFEVGNEKFYKGISILGGKCSKFLKSHKSCIPSSELIIQQHDNNKENFSEEEYLESESLVKSAMTSKPIFFLIRGHFLTNAVINFIKKEVRRLRKIQFVVPEEHLFVNLTSLFTTELLTNPTRPDIQYLKSQISSWL